MMWVVFGIAVLWLWPQHSYASIIISEIAWLHPYFVVVLTIVFIVWSFFCKSTKVQQSKGMGKMGILFLFLILPSILHADVIISEVAWMGTAVSANDEWIELFNDGDSSVSFDGWVLTDGDKLEINLAGAVGAGQYAVLERTNDDSAPGPAFLIYSGALKNTGSNLLLKRVDGTIEQELASGENWRDIGGNNTTKETAQYSEGNWVTGPATPGRENIKATDIPPVTYSDQPFVFATDNSLSNSDSPTTFSATANNLQSASLLETEVPNVLWPYFALVSLLFFSIGAVYLTKNG